MKQPKVMKIDDYLFKDEWNIKIMNVEPAWQLSTGEGTVVGVIDSGIDGSHEDFGWKDNIYITANDSTTLRKQKYQPVLDAIRKGTHPKILPGWNFVDDNDDTWDSYRHGTYMCGTIGALNNSAGTIGVAPSCKIRPYVIVNNDGYTTQELLRRAIYKAIEDKCDVINISLAWAWVEEETRKAIDDAIVSGMIVIAATGNNDVDYIYYPAACNKMIAVGGCNRAGERWVHSRGRGSNYGDGIVCIAPADDQPVVFFMRWRYTVADGTSQAAANVSGIAALAKSLDKSMTHGRFYDLICKNSSRKNIGWDTEHGWGVPDALKIVEASSGDPINTRFNNIADKAQVILADIEELRKQVIDISLLAKPGDGI